MVIYFHSPLVAYDPLCTIDFEISDCIRGVCIIYTHTCTYVNIHMLRDFYVASACIAIK